MDIINFKSIVDKLHPDYFEKSRNIPEMDEEAVIIMPQQLLFRDWPDICDDEIIEAEEEDPDALEDFMNPFADHDTDWLLDLEDILKD